MQEHDGILKAQENKKIIKNIGLWKGVMCFIQFGHHYFYIVNIKFNTGEWETFICIFFLYVFSNETTLLSQSAAAQIQLALECNVILCPTVVHIFNSHYNII